MNALYLNVLHFFAILSNPFNSCDKSLGLTLIDLKNRLSLNAKQSSNDIDVSCANKMQGLSTNQTDTIEYIVKSLY